MNRPLIRALRADDARNILINCGVRISDDFHALPSDKVAALLAWADKWHYRKPRNANGSRARYFHDYLQRLAAHSKED